MYNLNDETKSYTEMTREERKAFNRDIEEMEARMAKFDAGLISFSAAVRGGELYERELAESVLELKEEAGMADPIGAAIEGWLRAVGAGRRAA